MPGPPPAGENRPCAECGKQHYVRRWKLRERGPDGKFFCSKTCSAKHQYSDRVAAGFAPKPRGKRLAATCPVCGKMFYRFLSRCLRLKWENPTCSNECRTVMQRREAARARAARANCTCVICGDVFYRRPRIIKRNRLNYCSRACYLQRKRAASKRKSQERQRNSNARGVVAAAATGEQYQAAKATPLDILRGTARDDGTQFSVR